MKKQWYCDECEHLDPTEEAQSKTRVRDQHVCKQTGHLLRHGRHHPRLPRPDTCPLRVRLTMSLRDWRAKREAAKTK